MALLPWTSRLATRLRGNVAQSSAKRSAPPPAGHHLILYDYEASPWCRLVREYATILDLTLHVRPCPRQTLWQEGAYTKTSRFRPQAMALLQQQNSGTNDSNNHENTDLMFPILVDRTMTDKAGSPNPIVLQQSYAILEHLWKHYGQSVVPSSSNDHKSQNSSDDAQPPPSKRLDQIMNNPTIPFPLRFLSLAAPSYLRPWPQCGVFQIPSQWNHDANDEKALSYIRLYQSEGCWESRLVREMLCSMEIPYNSIPVAQHSQNKMPGEGLTSPVMTVVTDDEAEPAVVMEGVDACLNFLQNKYGCTEEEAYSLQLLSLRKLLYRIPPGENLGKQQQGDLAIGAYTAFLRGSRAFVPPRAME